MKSLIFRLFPIADCKVSRSHMRQRSPSTVLVICSLESIVEDQLIVALSYGLKAVSLASSVSKMSEQTRVCNVPDLIFASAEAVSQKAFRETLRRTQKINAIVVDETHTIERWKGKKVRIFLYL